MGYLIRPIEYLAAWLLKLRNRHFLVLDVLTLLLTPALALMLRLDSLAGFQEFERSLGVITVVFLLVKVAIFYVAGLYNRYWKYASIDELAKITLAVLFALGIQTVLFLMVLRPLGWVDPAFPRSVPLLEGLLALFLIGGSRYSVRLAQRLQQHVRSNGHGKGVLVFGAGEAGIRIVEEMLKRPRLGLRPLAFLDDNPEKQGMRIRGLDVIGGRHEIPGLVEEADAKLVIIALPSASGKAVRAVSDICREAGVETKTIPSVYELLDDRVSITSLRDVQVEDLLRRAPVRTDTSKVAAMLQGSRVMITGAGGSIGAELCRQILHLKPDELVLLGHGENSIFRIEAELRRRQEEPLAVRLHPVIADIRDRHRMEHVFATYRPDVVFHAAAHKHVPLMESNLEDAVTNNVEGTRSLLAFAETYDVSRFVLISTDKAVNPSSIMGATKRVAELLVHDAAVRTGRAFSVVRFGNVLGSRGSVLQVFREQLAQGGPLTVTHPDVRRYFMTIPEAVHLVLQAATMGQGGEVFLLEMGEPTPIVDLARDLIRLSGLEEGRGVDIVFTGLRPGEKMDEELAGHGESFGPTEHEKILVHSQNGTTGMTNGWTEEHHTRLRQGVDDLVAAARRGDTKQLVERLWQLVPEVHKETMQAALEDS
ncbi:MAG: polysaccharide biosynthesis protein [Rhodothermales bacterium]